jgi:hypothetical protein
MSDQKPTPLPRRDFIKSMASPYLKDGLPPVPGNGNINRGEQVSVRNDDTKIIKIGLEDIDTAVQYYFENVIKPTVYQNSNRVPVPVIVSSPETMKSVQTDGFYRDKAGKIMVPLIAYERKLIVKNKELGNKLDGNIVHNIQTFEQKFNKHNIYDNFSIIRNAKPSKSRFVGIIPDYVTVTYNCNIFTNYIEQNNNLIESIGFASDTYWGDPSAFMFRTRISQFNNTTFLEQGDDRAAKSSCEIVLNGYLIPDVLNKDLAVVQNKMYDVSKVVFTAETVTKLPNI